MEWQIILIIIFGALVILMLTGMPISFAFLTICVAGIIILHGFTDGLRYLAVSMQAALGNIFLLPVIMFILLGDLVFRSGVALKAIDVIDEWLGHLPGRLALLTVIISTIMATMSGSSMGTVALMGSTLKPEMERRGYKNSIIIGSIIGSGGLAILIPPSGMIVLWATIAEVSIGRLLIACVIPGFILAMCYFIYIVGRCYLEPEIAPHYELKRVSWSKKIIDALLYLVPLSFIVFMVTGLILLGIATPSESAVMGVVSAIILSIVYRKFSWNLVANSLTSTLKVAGNILIIISASIAFGQIISSTGAGDGLVNFVMRMSLPPIFIIIAMMVIVAIMGCFMGAVPIMMITIPIFVPMVNRLGFDPVWFGVMFLLNIEMSGTTPPFGILLFIMKSVAENVSFMEIVKSGFPFLVCDICAMIIFMAFPILSLWLPHIVFR